MADNWKVYYLFLDGVGFGSTDDTNPFYSQKTEIFHHLAQQTPYLSLWAQNEDGLDPDSNVYQHREKGLALKSIDPSSGVKGLPQSGTGQTSLFTGVDGPLVLDRHVPNFPSFTLKKFIKKYSLFKVLTDNGKKATLLNSYSPYYLDIVLPKGKFISASTLTQLAADQDLMTFHNLIRDESLYMDITYRFLIENHKNGDSRMLSGDWSGIDEEKLLHVQDPASRGRRFIEIAREFDYDVVLFEYFFTDKAGHDQDAAKCAEIISILDEFIRSAADSLGPRETLIISSDHGNMEDLSTKSHTHNSVPLYVFGDDPDFFLNRITRLAHIPRAILERFGIEHAFLGEAHAEEL